LRKALKFTCGKGRFTKKQLQVKDVVDERHLLIPLMLAERSWAMAMELKEEWQADPEDNARLKFHAHSRLKKATQWSEQLQQLASKTADPRSALETDAYHTFLCGSVALDREKWVAALKYFVHSQTVYEQLVKVVEPEHQALYRDRAEKLENNIRLCKYKCDRTQGDAVGDLKDLKSGIDDVLRAKLESVMQEARAKQAESMDRVDFLGRQVTLKNQKVCLLLLQAGDMAVEIELALTNPAAAVATKPAAASTEENAEEVQTPIDRYNSLFQLYDDAAQLVRADLREAEQAGDKKSTKAVFQEEQLLLLRDYISYRKLLHTIDRNVLLAQSLAADLNSADAAVRKHTKPEDVMHIYEMLQQNVESMTALLGDAADESTQKDMAARSLTYQANRCFYLALSHAAAGRRAEAFALLNRSAQLTDSARDHHRMRANVTQKDLTELDALSAGCAAQRCVVHATSVLQTQTPEAAAQESTSQAYLLERLDRFDAGEASAQHRLVRFPPQLEPAPCKPVLFDLAAHHLAFPTTLASKIKSASSSAPASAVKPATAASSAAPAAAAAPAKGGFFSSVGSTVGSLFGRRK
jgi:signal recognition particle subunit SRP68